MLYKVTSGLSWNDMQYHGLTEHIQLKNIINKSLPSSELGVVEPIRKPVAVTEKMRYQQINNQQTLYEEQQGAIFASLSLPKTYPKWVMGTPSNARMPYSDRIIRRYTTALAHENTKSRNSLKIKEPEALRAPKESSPVRQLQQVSVAEEYRAKLARKLMETHSHADDEDCLEVEWRRVKEALLPAFRTVFPGHLARLNEHWTSLRPDDLTATSDYDDTRRATKHRITKGLKNAGEHWWIANVQEME
ncbi:hypothetical protein CLF_107321 [Clonorchis sinensis]|uniref:ATP-binding cassette transporter n=1 Tax=Clonorchis sinensis TaxID=79923 RepID=G7YGK5_CLOSI|nr:hypothetical protein CLF_107321 [Clonorchis sinensis]